MEFPTVELVVCSCLLMGCHPRPTCQALGTHVGKLDTTRVNFFSRVVIFMHGLWVFAGPCTLGLWRDQAFLGLYGMYYYQCIECMPYGLGGLKCAPSRTPKSARILPHTGFNFSGTKGMFHGIFCYSGKILGAWGVQPSVE